MVSKFIIQLAMMPWALTWGFQAGHY